MTSQSDGVLISPGEKRWDRRNADGTHWVVEIETDCFNEVDGHVVSLWVESTDGLHDVQQASEALAEVTPEQAREMAAHLIRCAEAIEATR